MSSLLTHHLVLVSFTNTCLSVAHLAVIFNINDVFFGINVNGCYYFISVNIFHISDISCHN